MKHRAYQIAEELQVAQASGLSFRVSRPKLIGCECNNVPESLLERGFFSRSKSGVTPDVTGVTPVPPPNQ